MRVHACVDQQLGTVIPYGVFDLSRNEGWGSVGIDPDTAQFAVRAIGRGGQQREPISRVEGRATGVGHAPEAAPPCAPCPARNQHMEQD